MLIYAAENIFKSKDYIEIMSDSGEHAIVVQLQGTYLKGPPGNDSNKKNVVISLLKTVLDAHPMFKVNQSVIMRVLSEAEL